MGYFGNLTSGTVLYTLAYVEMCLTILYGILWDSILFLTSTSVLISGYLSNPNF